MNRIDKTEFVKNSRYGRPNESSSSVHRAMMIQSYECRSSERHTERFISFIPFEVDGRKRQSNSSGLYVRLFTET